MGLTGDTHTNGQVTPQTAGLPETAGVPSPMKVSRSEELKEIYATARKIARKQKRPLADRDCLKAMLVLNRAFTSGDSLLKHLGLPPSKLEKDLKALDAAHPMLDTQEGPAPAVADRLAWESNPPQRRTAKVELEHLVQALSISRDEAVAPLFTQVTTTRVAQAAADVRKRQGFRMMLFFGRELVEVVAFVLVFLVLIKSFIGELRLIPSESMLPGLRIDDRVVIERVTQPFRPYQRGDVLVFYPPDTQLKDDPWSVFLRLTGFSGLLYKKEDNIDVAFIKRLIGMPGDKVEVRANDGVYINGKKLNEPYVAELAKSCTMVQPFPYCGQVEVPEGEYFMLGDNRNQSADSRYWGFEPKERVIGRAVYRIWPLSRLGPLETPPYQQR